MKKAGNNEQKKPWLSTCISGILMLLCMVLTAGTFAERATERPAGSGYYALLIGQTHPGEGNASLDAAVSRDLRSMEQMLQEMTGTPYRIRSCVNPGREELAEEIETAFLDAGPEDTCLLYYGGHGRYSAAESRKGVMEDADGEWITAEELLDMLDAARGKKIIILDSCYAGMLIRGLEAGKGGAQGNGAYFILTAAGEEEEAKNGGRDETEYGWFTWSLLYGSGYDERTEEEAAVLPADLNGDDAVSLREAWQYTRAVMAGVSEDQHPEVYPEEGDLILWSR